MRTDVPHNEGEATPVVPTDTRGPPKNHVTCEPCCIRNAAWCVMRLRGDERRGLMRDLQIAHHRPQIAHQFARDGHHGDLRATP